VLRIHSCLWHGAVGTPCFGFCCHLARVAPMLRFGFCALCSFLVQPTYNLPVGGVL
jgi:hypothetical protein